MGASTMGASTRGCINPWVTNPWVHQPVGHKPVGHKPVGASTMGASTMGAPTRGCIYPWVHLPVDVYPWVHLPVDVCPWTHTRIHTDPWTRQKVPNVCRWCRTRALSQRYTTAGYTPVPHAGHAATGYTPVPRSSRLKVAHQARVRNETEIASQKGGFYLKNVVKLPIYSGISRPGRVRVQPNIGKKPLNLVVFMENSVIRTVLTRFDVFRVSNGHFETSGHGYGP